MVVDPNIKKKADDIRTRIKGVEVRESLASGLEAMSTDVTETISRQMQLGSQWQAVSDEMTDKDVISAPEIIAARNGEANLKARLDKDRNEVTEQLAQTNKEWLLTPDAFEGTDAEKMQKLVDYCSENGIKSAYLNRTYDITGSTIYLPADDWVFPATTFTGGGIVKNDNGYVFDRIPNNMDSNSPIFINTTFFSESEAILYNGNKMIRQNLTNCSFKGMSLVHVDGYIQTLRLINCETENHHKDFIKANMVFDGLISGHRGESSHHSLVNIQSKESTELAAYNLRIVDSIIEGYTNSTPIVLSAGYGIFITDCYFEANKTSIRFDKGLGTTRLHASLNNLTFGSTRSDYDIEFIDFQITIPFVNIENITSNVPTGKFLTNLKFLFREFKNINLFAGGKFADTEGRSERRHVHTYPFKVNDLGSEGIEVEFELQLANTGNLITYEGKQYLLNISGGYGNSGQYSAHLTAILSIDGYSNSGEIVQGLNVSELSTRNTGAVNNGNIANPANYSYFFKETNTKEIDSYAEKTTIVLKFPDLNTNNFSATLLPIKFMSSYDFIDI